MRLLKREKMDDLNNTITYICTIKSGFSEYKGIIGVVIGFFSSFILEKIKFTQNIKLEEARKFLQKKVEIINTVLSYYSKYNFHIKTLHDYYEDELGIPIKEVKEKDIYVKYFLEIIGYLDKNRFFLNDNIVDFINKNLIDHYHAFLLDKKIAEERSNDDDGKKLEEIKNDLFKDPKENFEKLKDMIVEESKLLKEKFEKYVK